MTTAMHYSDRKSNQLLRPSQGSTRRISRESRQTAKDLRVGFLQDSGKNRLGSPEAGELATNGGGRRRGWGPGRFFPVARVLRYGIVCPVSAIGCQAKKGLHRNRLPVRSR